MILCRLFPVVLLVSTSSAKLYSSYSFDPLEHLGGIAPTFQPQDPPTDPSAPRGCSVSRAAHLVRHAAIYANDYDYESYIEPFFTKLANHSSSIWRNSTLPELVFLSTYSPPITSAEQELLTRTGKLEATELAVQLSFRYPMLRAPQRIWASSASRTKTSAQSFIRGFETDDNKISLVVVPEGKEDGANSLTPYSSCPNYSGSAGSKQSSVYQDLFTAPILARFNAAVPAFNFTVDDVFGMMELCGYESVIRGSSPLCSLDLFGPDEWLGWEYTSDVMYHYNVGYGSNVAGAVGLPWFTSTSDLLTSPLNSTTVQDLYVSFTHRELPPMVLVAMGLFNNSAYSGNDNVNATMPLDRINYRRAWKSSHILPFLSDVAVERLNCTGSAGFADGDYYRIKVNDAPQGLQYCNDGPGTSCSRSAWLDYIAQRQSMFDGYSTTCGVTYDNSTDVLTIYDMSGNGTLVGKRR